MSRVGKTPVKIPDGVEVDIQDRLIRVKGPRGELQWNFPVGMKVNLQDKAIVVKRPNDTKPSKSLHGTTRSVISNMVTGVSDGYQRVLEISGVGYRAQVQGRKVTFSLGYSQPIEFDLPDGITAEVDKRQTQLTIRGIEKRLVGQVAANIRSLRPPNPYKGKGVKYSGELVRLKEGKKGK